MKYKKTILKNGIRLITVPMKDNPTVTALVMVEAGSRYETLENNGISHFLEHMCFKGTENRTYSDISYELDKIGAQYNAFTSYDCTGYYAKSHHKNLPEILDVLSDIYLNSDIPQVELDKERGVIIEEINMYEDLPQRKVYDIFTNLLYGKHPMGWTIIGPKENIKKMTREDFLKYREQFYFGNATTVVVAGNIEQTEVKKLVEKMFAKMESKKLIKPLKISESQKTPALKMEYKKTDQSHLILGFRTFDLFHKDKTTLEVLNAVLSAGMSSRLFKKMREELGICYYIKSFLSFSYDAGYLGVRSGVGNGRLEEAISGIIKELQKMKEELVNEKELEKTKNILISELVMHMETSNDHAEFYAEQEIFHEEIKSPNEMVKEIKKITPADLQKLAKKIFIDVKMNLAVIGPNQNEAEILKLLKI